LAWSPWADGKTAIKASAGRHYNNIPLLIPLQELEPIHTTVEFRTSLVHPDQCPPPDPHDPDPPEFACGQAKLVGGIQPLITTRTVDRNLATPYQDEFTLKLERELWPETSVGLTYIRRKFRDQIQDVNVNVDSGDLGRCVRQTNQQMPHLEPSPGTSTRSCSATPVECQADSDCPTGETCGFFFDLGEPGGWLTDPYTGVTYPDTDPGDGDGFLDPVTGSTDDNCTGRLAVVVVGEDPCQPEDPFCDSIQVVRRPDDRPDLYLQNPFWGDVFLIGNSNSIDYEAFVLELARRQYRGWEMNASYTWSEARGDGEDFFQELGDDPTLRDNVFGFQSYDQTHVVKLNATTVTPWGVRLGTSVTWQSGLPYSLLLERLSLDSQAPITNAFGAEGSRPRQLYLTGSRNDQRNASYWNVDVKVTREFRLATDMQLQLSAEIFNLLDDDTYQVYNPYFGRGVQVNGRNEAFRRFGRRWQVGMRLTF
jgi:hypothetical protein